MVHHLKALQDRFPEQARTIGCIRELRDRIDSVHLEPFFEPKSLFDFSGPKPVMSTVGPSDLTAWCRHVADGSTARLASLEDGFFSELFNDRLVSAMVIARAHMEVAGLAAYALNALFGAARTGDWMRLTQIVQKTYFGSSMSIQAKGTPELQDYLLEEVCPMRPGNLVKAMDRFAVPDDPSYTRYQLVYGLMSEFAHPVMSGTKDFAEIVQEDFEGWFIRYRGQALLTDDSVKMACELVLGNMRVAYACCAMLRVSEVIPGPSYNFVLHGPSKSQIAEIWTDILDQPLH
jgi:hypothetical protein